MGDNDMLSTEFCIEWLQPLANRATLEVGSTSFEGVLHDNLSNKKRQGSGFAPPILKSYPGANLYRDNAVGINFEHICNGAKEQYDISMFTPRQEPCHLKQARENRHELHWPSKGSKWGMKARMVYDLSKEDQVDLVFECTPTVALYSQRFAIMMWASYIHTARTTGRFTSGRRRETGRVGPHSVRYRNRLRSGNHFLCGCSESALRGRGTDSQLH